MGEEPKKGDRLRLLENTVNNEYQAKCKWCLSMFFGGSSPFLNESILVKMQDENERRIKVKGIAERMDEYLKHSLDEWNKLNVNSDLKSS